MKGALVKAAYNCAAMAGIAVVTTLVTCAVVGINADNSAFTDLVIAAIGGGITIGGLVTAFGGDVRII
jgi:hypothetical protein